MILYADWSSTALVLLLVAPDGRIAGRRESRVDGAMSVAAGLHAERLAALAADWLATAEAIYVSGMATARGGWHDTGYVAAPAAATDMLARAVPMGSVGKCPVFLLPGLSVASEPADIMRGEEVKAWGLAASFPGLVVIPGKHSKWIGLDGGVIRHFATFLSGEIGALLRRDSILSRLVPEGASLTDEGVAAGISAAAAVRQLGGGVLRGVFSARSSVLMGGLRAGDVPGYLEGFIIAAEIDEARTEFLARFPGKIVLIGEAELCDRYATALAAVGRQSERHDGHDLGARAIAAIHRLQKFGTHAHNMEPIDPGHRDARQTAS